MSAPPQTPTASDIFRAEARRVTKELAKEAIGLLIQRALASLGSPRRPT